jgi:membrane AbrB-like protein
MTQPRESGSVGRLTGSPPAAQWTILIVVSVALATLFHLLGIPAAFLVGPLLAGILVGTNGGDIRVPVLPYLAGQSVVGSMIAHSITLDIVLTFLGHWPLFLGVVFAILAASSLLGWLMTRWQVLPGTTAVWGASPGAATPMMLMAQAYGADARLVAFMQYLRVVFVAITAAVMARFWLSATPGGAVHAIDWLRPVDWLPFAETVAVAGIGAFLGRRFGIPAGGFLVPLAIGTVLGVSGLLRIELPEPLLIVSFALLGWSVGLSFTRTIIMHALKAMPQIALSTAALIAFCGLLAFMLVRMLGIDPLTAYLATSPGGMDSVAIIAASTKVDVPFVMAMQTFRFVVVLALGPSLARLVARSTAGTDHKT